VNGVAMESDAAGTVSIAYKMQDPNARTIEKPLPLRGANAFMTMSLMAPAFAPRLTMPSDTMESFTTMTIFFDNLPGTAGNAP
jgi:hypothetical protein